MYQRIVVLAMAALSLAACADSTTGVIAPNAAAAAKAIPEPKGAVVALFTVHVGGHVINRAAGPVSGKSWGGSCDNNGRWNATSQRTAITTDVNDVHCADHFEGASQVVQASVPGTFLLLGDYRELYFPLTCNGGCESNTMQYRRVGDFTRGMGGVTANDALGNQWTFDFTQPALNTPGNVISREGTLVVGCAAGIGCGPAVLTW